MRIIKEGNPANNVRFTCKNCHCIFEEEPRYCGVVSVRPGVFALTCECPCCGAGTQAEYKKIEVRK